MKNINLRDKKIRNILRKFYSNIFGNDLYLTISNVHKHNVHFVLRDFRKTNLI